MNARTNRLIESMRATITSKARDINRALVPSDAEVLKGYLAIEYRDIDDEIISEIAGAVFSEPTVDHNRPALPPFDHRTGTLLPSDLFSITQSAEHIFRKLARLRCIFRKGGSIVELTSINGMGNKSHRTAQISESGFCSRVELLGDVYEQKMLRGTPIIAPARLTQGQARLLLESPAAQNLPQIHLISELPVAIEIDGKFELLQGGFHESFGIYVCHGAKMELPPVEDAVESLLGLLSGFKFVSNADKSRAIAGMMTPAIVFGRFNVGRNAVLVVQADESQTGKTLMTRAIAAIYGIEQATVAKNDGGVGSLDEALAEKFLQSAPIILIDNFRGKLSSQFLEAATGGVSSIACRAPYSKPVNIDPRSTVIQITSNGAELTVDMANRMNLVRILKQRTTDAWPDLMCKIKDRQIYYLSCVYAVVKAWYDAGKPVNNVVHDFARWAGIVDWIATSLFNLPSPSEGLLELKEQSASHGGTWLRSVAIGIKRMNLCDQQLTTMQLINVCHEMNLPLPGKDHRGDDRLACQAAGRTLGAAFRKAEVVEIDDVSITRIREKDAKEGGIINKYIFQTAGGEFLGGTLSSSDEAF